jgi:hypothetical protein
MKITDYADELLADIQNLMVGLMLLNDANQLDR